MKYFPYVSTICFTVAWATPGRVGSLFVNMAPSEKEPWWLRRKCAFTKFETFHMKGVPSPLMQVKVNTGMLTNDDDRLV